MYDDDQILFDELEQQRNRSGRRKRKSLRLPVYEPEHREEQHAESDDEQQDNERGVKVLDMRDGYTVIE